MAFWYHGTTEENAASILREGFREHTTFGRHLEDSLNFGGDFIFIVYFTADPTDYWEYISRVPIPVSRIYELLVIQKEVRYHSADVERENLDQCHKEQYGEGAIICEPCGGSGQLDKYPPYTHWRDRLTCIVCEACGGYGVANLDRRTLQLTE
jgi:hypothetical protein